jgi:phosphoribosylaminoimidazole-succinocarboxamide synthase
MTTNEKLDKDRFRRDLGGEAEAYQEVARTSGAAPGGRGETWCWTRHAPQETGK